MNRYPNYPYPENNFYEAPSYPTYYYQPIVPSQPQLFLKQQMTKPKLASTLRAAQKGITTATRIIPLVYQIQPVLANAKTVFKVAQAMKNINNTTNDEPIDNEPIDIKPIENTTENPNTIPKPYLP